MFINSSIYIISFHLISLHCSQSSSSYILDATNSPCILQFHVADTRRGDDPSFTNFTGNIVYCPSQYFFFLSSGECVLRQDCSVQVHIGDQIELRNVHRIFLSSFPYNYCNKNNKGNDNENKHGGNYVIRRSNDDCNNSFWKQCSSYLILCELSVVSHNNYAI